MSVYANFAEFSNPGTYKVTVPPNTNSIKIYLVGLSLIHISEPTRPY